MPVAAAVLADVGAGDADPLVSSRVGEHALQQLSIALPELRLLGQRPARLANPLGQRVAHPLELLEAGDPGRARRRGDAGIDAAQRKGLRDEAGQLALEAADLTTQLRPREALVASLKSGVSLPFEQTRHRSRV